MKTIIPALVLFFILAVMAIAGKEKKAGILPLPPPYKEPSFDAETIEGATNVARVATITVSSTHTGEEGEGEATAINDGNPKTRWSSMYSAPQFVVMDFGKEVEIYGIKIYWERASAVSYSISAAGITNSWKKIHFHYKNEKEIADRTDRITISPRVKTAKIRFDLQKNINPEWGFSIYEIEVFAKP